MGQAEAALGTVNILVNNAGIPDAQRAVKMSVDLIDRVIGVNLRAPYILSCEVARRLMAAKQPGRIVNIASVAAFEYSGNGQLPRPKVRVSNIIGTITALLLSLPDGLEGAKFTRIRTLARYIDGANFPGGTNPYGTPDPTAEFPREIYYVDRKVIETRDVVEFELAAAFDLAGVRAPKRQCIANICQWVYKSTECSYTGALTSCSKTLDACKAHFGATAELPFGSFPGIGSYFT